MSSPVVHVAFGGNLGEVEQNLHRALSAVGALPGTRLRRVSSLYRTAPVGITAQPPFLNGAMELASDLEPERLLDALLAIEQSLGRTREVRWGPRTVDLDILLWESRIVRMPRLEIPHPRLHERAFVLVPLAEIAPQAVHPVLGRTVGELRAALGDVPDVVSQGRPPWVDRLEEGNE